MAEDEYGRLIVICPNCGSSSTTNYDQYYGTKRPWRRSDTPKYWYDITKCHDCGFVFNDGTEANEYGNNDNHLKCPKCDSIDVTLLGLNAELIPVRECNNCGTKYEGKDYRDFGGRDSRKIVESKATEERAECPKCWGSGRSFEDAGSYEICERCNGTGKIDAATEGGLGSGRKGHQGWMREVTELKTNKHKIPQEHMSDSKFLREFANDNHMCNNCMNSALESLIATEIRSNDLEEWWNNADFNMRADVLTLAGVDTSWANGEFRDLDGGVAWRLRDFISDAGTGGVDHDAQTTWSNPTGGQIAPKEYFWADDEKYGKDQIHGGVMGDYESKASEVIDPAIQKVLRDAEQGNKVSDYDLDQLKAVADAEMLGLIDGRLGSYLSITNAGKQALDSGNTPFDFMSGDIDRADVIGSPSFGESQATEDVRKWSESVGITESKATEDEPEFVAYSPFSKDGVMGGKNEDLPEHKFYKKKKEDEAWTYEPDDGFCPYCDQPVDWHDFDNHVNAHRENGDMRLPELAGDYQGDNVEQIS